MNSCYFSLFFENLNGSLFSVLAYLMNFMLFCTLFPFHLSTVISNSIYSVYGDVIIISTNFDSFFDQGRHRLEFIGLIQFNIGKAKDFN